MFNIIKQMLPVAYCAVMLNVFGQIRAEDDRTGLTTVVPQKIERDNLADAINNLGYKITSAMVSSNNDKNIVISPAGIAGLLAMTLLGTVGRSYDELADALGFSQDVKINRENHELFGDILKNLNSNGTSSKTTYADVIFVDSASHLREAYRSYLGRVYNGDAKDVDFTDRETVKTIINERVSNTTNGKITDFLKDPLPATTKVALLSSLYFSGQWASPFIPEYTMQMPFKKGDKEIMSDLMLNLGDFNYVHSLEDELHMIAIPYNDSVTTLYALKPLHPNKLSLVDLLSKLNYTKIDSLINQMTSKKSIIRFPKMDIKSTSNLDDSLKSLGVQSIFTPGQANFALMIDNNKTLNKTEDELITRINDGEDLQITDLRKVLDVLPSPGIHVDTILHDVRIKIDEYGTEAVAATSGILARSAQMFYADSPFYMFIRNEITKLITFSAVIFDPTT